MSGSTSANSLKTIVLEHSLTKGKTQMPRESAFPGFTVDWGQGALQIPQNSFLPFF